MMLSSIQCFDILHTLSAIDEQILRSATEIGRWEREESGEKLFQKLILIFRDWFNPHEMSYGFQESSLVVNDDLRHDIFPYFNETESFLMSHPGVALAGSVNLMPNSDLISSSFKANLQILVPALLAPENLVVKKINGRVVQARDFVKYFRLYIEIFNETAHPEPETIKVVIFISL